MNTFENFISLGYFCSVAQETERLGFRNASFPFDWIITDFEGIFSAIENNFEGFLEEKYLAQSKKNLATYKNLKFNLYFFHDFSKYHSLKSQLKNVRAKYSRRINRFYREISKPTLFIRYISDLKRDEAGRFLELEWIESNINHIRNTLKMFNQKNEIIFVANDCIKSDKIKIYNVQPDINDLVARKFFEKNEELSNLFESFEFDKKEHNLKIFRIKDEKKKDPLRIFIKKITAKLERNFLKEYVHSVQYEE